MGKVKGRLQMGKVKVPIIYIRITPRLKDLLDLLTPYESSFIMREALYRAISILDKETRKVRSLESEGFTINRQVTIKEKEVRKAVKGMGHVLKRKLTLLVNEIAEQLVMEMLEARKRAKEKLREMQDEIAKRSRRRKRKRAHA